MSSSEEEVMPLRTGTRSRRICGEPIQDVKVATT
jgi:hypothetical protein